MASRLLFAIRSQKNAVASLTTTLDNLGRAAGQTTAAASTTTRRQYHHQQSRSSNQSRSILLVDQQNNYSQRRRTIMTTNGNKKLVTLESMNQNVIKMEYAVRGPLVIRATEIERELKEVSGIEILCVCVCVFVCE